MCTRERLSVKQNREHENTSEKNQKDSGLNISRIQTHVYVFKNLTNKLRWWKALWTVKRRRQLKVKKGAVLIIEAEMVEIYFSWKKLLTFCWVTWNRNHLICAKNLCKRCAHTQVSERIRSSIIRTFKRCIFWQKLDSSLSEVNVRSLTCGLRFFL